MKNIENLRFPSLLVLVLMVLTPVADKAVFGTYTVLTYIVEGGCALAVLGLIGAAVYNTFWKN